MADGTTKPLSEIKVGDEVLATDPDTGEQGPRKVAAVLVHQDTVVDLVVNDGAKVTTTEDHLFYNATDSQWQRADQIDPGDLLRTADGSVAKMAGLRPRSTRLASAYNLSVEDIHTYYVVAGRQFVLVHNECPPFVAGQTWYHKVQTSAGEVEALAMVEAEGQTLILRDLAVYPAGAGGGRGSLGPGGAGELLKIVYEQLGPQAASQGYVFLRIVADRRTGPVGRHVDLVFQIGQP